MNKTELIAAVAEASDLPRDAVGKAVETTLEIITQTLQAGEQVSLVGFGTFTVRERAARAGRNPRSGEEILIKASKTPAFKAGKGLKDAVN